MKAIQFILAIYLAAGLAFGALAENVPETRESYIELEGMKEPVLETLYESPMGYRVWVADMFTYKAPDEGNDMDAFVPSDEHAVPGVGLYINYSNMMDYTLDMAREDVKNNLEENGYAVTEADAARLFPLYKAYGFHGIREDSVTEVYVVQAEEGEFYLTIEYPLVAAEGYGARLSQLAATFELMESE